METYIIILLCAAAFAAGFIDAIVGGGTHSNSRRINFIT
jgi:uncharacterized membrane protein YfcA